MFTRLSKPDIRFIAFLVLLHAAYFVAATVFQCIFNGDSQEYIDMAHNISKGALYAGNMSQPLSPELYTLRPPGYSFFMWLVYTVSDNWGVLLVQNIISICNVMVLRRILQRIGYNIRYDWIFMLFLLLFPSQCVNANIIAPDLLLQTTVVFYFASFIKFIQEKQWRYALYMSLWLAAGLMLKPVAYPLAYLHALLLILAGAFVYKALLRSIACALVPVLVIMLYSGINYMRTDKYHFSSIQSFNAIFYYYNYYTDTKGVDEGLAFLNAERAHIASMPRFADRYDYANHRGMQLLKDNFGGYMFYHTTHSLRMLIDPGKAEMDMFTGKLTLEKLYDVHDTSGFSATLRTKGISGLRNYIARNPSLPVVLLVLLFNCIRLVGLLLFLFNRGIDYRVRLFVFLLTGYFVFIAGAISHVRYFMPVSLIAMGCAAIGYGLLLQRLRNKSIIVTAK